jgi:hypothetical protein
MYYGMSESYPHAGRTESCGLVGFEVNETIHQYVGPSG